MCYSGARPIFSVVVDLFAKTLVANLLYALTIPSDILPKHIRFANLPGIGVSIQENDRRARKCWISSVEVAKGRRCSRSPHNFVLLARAYKMGFKPDQPFEDTVRDYQRVLAKSKAKGVNGYTA
ncbi:hypothetical protein V1506DRAFT_563520 [Lipomyces tetrasporus]